MGKCSYTWKEWDKEQGRIERSCPHDTWEGSDEFCIFHDPSPYKDRDLFIEKLKEQMESEKENTHSLAMFFLKTGIILKIMNLKFLLILGKPPSMMQTSGEQFSKKYISGALPLKTSTFGEPHSKMQTSSKPLSRKMQTLMKLNFMEMLTLSIAFSREMQTLVKPHFKEMHTSFIPPSKMQTSGKPSSREIHTSIMPPSRKMHNSYMPPSKIFQ